MPTLPDTPWKAGYADKVTDWLWIGGAITGPKMLASLVERGVTHVLSVADDHDDRPTCDPVGVIPLHIPWADDVPDDPQKKPVLDFLTALGWALSGDRSLSLQNARFCVYIHCDSGKHRSALMATFLLAVLGGLSRRAAYDQVKAAHPAAKMWHLKPYRHSLRRAMKAGRAFLLKERPLGPLGQQALKLQEAREEALAADDAAPDSPEPLPLPHAPSTDNNPLGLGGWKPDVPLSLPPAVNRADRYLPWDANVILDWLVLGAHIKGGDKPDEASYGPNGDNFVLWLAQIGVTHILNVAAEHDDAPEATKRDLAQMKLWWPDDDETPAPYAPPLQDVVAALIYVIEANARLAAQGRRFGLYLHCHSGMHRAPWLAIVLVALLVGLPMPAAYAVVKARRQIDFADTPGYYASAYDRIEALRPVINPQTPINSLPALRRLQATLPPVLTTLPPRYSFDGQGRTVYHAPDGRVYRSDMRSTRSDPDSAQRVASEDDQRMRDQAPGHGHGHGHGNTLETSAHGVPALSGYHYTALDQASLETNIFQAMRTAFLARWAELGQATKAPPHQALLLLATEAKAVAAGMARTHNRGVTRVAAEASSRWATAQQQQQQQQGRQAQEQQQTSLSSASSLHAALHAAIGDWLCTYRAPAAARAAARQCSLGAQLADLYCGSQTQGAAARYLVVGGSHDPASETCAECSAWAGRELDSQGAWQFLSQLHPGCEHRVQLLPPATAGVA